MIPSVLIVIVIQKAAPAACECLRGALAQDWPSLGVVVVDATEEGALSISCQPLLADDRAAWFRVEPGTTLAQVRQLLASAFEFSAITIHTSDLIPTIDKVTAQAEALFDRSDVDRTLNWRGQRGDGSTPVIGAVLGAPVSGPGVGNEPVAESLSLEASGALFRTAMLRAHNKRLSEASEDLDVLLLLAEEGVYCQWHAGSAWGARAAEHVATPSPQAPLFRLSLVGSTAPTLSVLVDAPWVSTLRSARTRLH